MGKLLKMIVKKGNKVFYGGYLHIEIPKPPSFEKDMLKKLQEKLQVKKGVSFEIKGNWAIFLQANDDTVMGTLEEKEWKKIKLAREEMEDEEG